MPKLRKCFEIGGKTYSGKQLANNLRALSWDDSKGVFSVVLSNEKLETYCLELTKADVALFLNYYLPGHIANHFGGDKGRAAKWLQTSRKILNDPTNQAERADSPHLRSLAGLKDRLNQTSTRITQKALFLGLGLKAAIEKVRSNTKKDAKKFQKGSKQG